MAVGVGVAALGLAVRQAAKHAPQFAKEAEMIMKSGKLPVSVS